MATPVNITMGSTLTIGVSFQAGTITFVPAPQVIEEPSLVVPIRLGAGVVRAAAAVTEPPLVIPVIFGPLTIIPGDPSDPPPPPPIVPVPPAGGGESQGGPAQRPTVGGTDAVSGTGSVPVRGVQVVGG
jgi:hypothetical protein